MEDRHVTLSEIAPGVFYSAVFDGHGGPKTAEFAQQHLQTMIRNRDSLTGTQQRFRNFWKILKNFRWWIRIKRFEFFQKTRFRSSLCRRIYFNRQADFTKNWWVIWFNSNCSSYWSRSSLLRKFNKISLRKIHYVIKMSLPDHILPDKIITILTSLMCEPLYNTLLKRKTGY